MKTYYLLRIAAYIVKFVPPRAVYWLCSIIGGIVFTLNWRVREAVLDNMGHVIPKASRHLRRVLGRRIVRNVVKNYYDVLRVTTMSPADLESSITVHGLEHLDAALKLGKGVILVSGHIGNFSIVAQLAASLNYEVSVVAEDVEPPKLYDYVNRLRGHFGLNMLKLGSSEVRTIYRLLRNNEILLLAIDRDVTNDGILVEFFGQPTHMPHGAVALALRTGAAILPGYTVRMPDNTSIVIIDPPIEIEHTGDKEEDVRVNMRTLAELLERYIIEAPDQWVVLQKIWDKDYTKDRDAGTGDRNGHSAEGVPPEPKQLAPSSTS